MMARSDGRRGIILVTVLWVVALLSALAMAAAITFRGFAGIVALDRDRVQAEALLTAGLEAGARAAAMWGDTPVDYLETTITLSTGSASVQINDEGGRIDIAKAPVEVIAGLLRVIGAPEEEADALAQAIAQWRKPPASDVYGPTGPPNASAAASNVPVIETELNPPFTDVHQLARVPGMTPEWVAAIAPLTTVYGSETVNPLTAPAEVLAALPGVDASRTRAFVERRHEFAADPAQLASLLGTAQKYVGVSTRPVLSVHVTATLVNGFSQAARAVIVLMPRDVLPYRILVWDPLLLQSAE
jgi:general secretion pathway protein K